MKLRVGTRRSPLATTQTRQALEELLRRDPALSWEPVEIVTTGDRISDKPLREAGGKGLFLKELDEALVEGRIDCAVHSLKDVPTEIAPGTVVAAVLERADARDVLVTRRDAASAERNSSGGALATLAALPRGSVLGTTSLRRQAQALAAAPSLEVRLLRGNVETRLRKLASGDCDATFLAAAGLARLGIALGDGARGAVLDPFEFIPAPGQGALAITAREGDGATLEALGHLDHEASRLAAAAERGFARVFGGGCHLPLAAYARLDGDELSLAGLLIAPDGRTMIRDETRTTLAAAGSSAQREQAAAELGAALARSFFDRGARGIVAAAEALARPSS